MKKIAILCVTRSRPQFERACRQSWAEHQHTHSDFISVIPREQEDLYTKEEGDHFIVHPYEGITGIVKPANCAAHIVMNNYKILHVSGDDNMFRTENWEEQVLEAMRDCWLVYGNDLHNTLVGPMFVRSDVVRALGWYFYPGLRHLYVDNVWTELAQAIGKGTRYLEGVVIEHMHPDAGKRPMDELTAATNSRAEYDSARQVFYTYMQTQFANDVLTIKSMIDG